MDCGVFAVPTLLRFSVANAAVYTSCPRRQVRWHFILAGIVEEFGKFSRLINPGFNMINPCTEEIREVDMRIKIITPGANYCITKDNVKLTISSSIAYRVVNPIQVYYILGNQLNHAIVEATHSSIRNVIGETVLDDVLLRRA